MNCKRTVFTLVAIASFGFSILNAQTCSGGMAGIYPCSNIDLAAHMDIPTMRPGASSGVEGNDIWGWTSPSTGKEYALVGLTDGTAFVDVSTPSTPVLIGHLASVSGGTSLWRDIKVVNNYAYIGSEQSNHDLQVFDLSQLDGATGLPVTFTAPLFDILGTGKSHNVVAFPEENLVATVGGGTFGGGLAFYDVSTPSSPSSVGGYANPTNAYSHDALCVVYRGTDTKHIGKKICFGFNEDFLVAVDVTDITSPITLGSTSYTGVSYAHQGWISDDHNYIYLNDELDGNSATQTKTHIINIADLESMFREAVLNGSSVAIDHNLYIQGNYMYQANYRAGLRIFDIQNRTAPSEVAFFDVFPTNNNRAFNGAWSVYPYFKSGTIIVNSIEDGLFVLEPTTALEHYVMENVGTGIQTVTQGTNAVFTVDLTAYYGYTPNVNISLSGVPAGAAAGFAASVSPNGTATITISNTDMATPGNYQLILTGNAGTASEEQLSLGLRINAILPIELVNFTASAKRNSILLNWETATEIQNKGFEIQRSISNRPNQFEPIGWVDGQGDSEISQTYTYEDSAVKMGVLYYYRLRQVDEDGTESFSKIVTAKVEAFDQKVAIFPNPVADFLNVKFEAFDFPIQNVEMSVVNVSGQILYYETIDIPAGEVNYNLETKDWSEGIYVLRFLVDDEAFQKRFVKM